MYNRGVTTFSELSGDSMGDTRKIVTHSTSLFPNFQSTIDVESVTVLRVKPIDSPLNSLKVVTLGSIRIFKVDLTRMW